MHLKRYHYYRIRFSGNWSILSGAFLGLSVFLRILYYFVFTDIPIMDRGMTRIVLDLGVPIFLCSVYMIMLICIRLDAPGFFGILGTLLCAYIIGFSFTTNDVFRIVFSFIGYILISVILLATVGGYFPGRLCAFLGFAVVLFIRFFLNDLITVRGIDWLLEGSCLSILVALMCLPMSLKAVKKKTAARRSGQ